MSAWPTMKSRSLRSLSVSGSSFNSAVGKFRPLPGTSLTPASLPRAMRTRCPPCASPMIEPWSWPSSSDTSSPTSMPSSTAGSLQVAWKGTSGIAGSISRVRRTRSPMLRRVRSGGVSTRPTRTLGPPMSMRIGRRRFVRSSAARMLATMRVHSRGPSWAQLMRITSAPRSAKVQTIAGSSAASVGRVTMIRPTRSGRDGPKISATRSERRASPRKKLASEGERKRPALSPASGGERDDDRIERNQDAALQAPERGDAEAHQPPLQRTEVMPAERQVMGEIERARRKGGPRDPLPPRAVELPALRGDLAPQRHYFDEALRAPAP